MTLFSFRTLAVAWTGLAGTAAVGAAALQASYVPPPAPPPAQTAAAPLAMPPPAAKPATVPFENRSLLAMLPPARPPARPAAPPAEPLPLPPLPPLRVVHAEPRRFVPARMPEPAYAAAEPSYPEWAWRGRLPYPSQYAAAGRGFYYGGGGPGYYGWRQPEY